MATVDENGLVTGKSAGSATVTVRTVDGGYTAQCSVTVEGEEIVAVTGVRLDYEDITVDVGGTCQLNATVEPEDAGASHGRARTRLWQQSMRTAL